MDRTPSDIELDDESGRGKFDSHESFGYKQTSGASYTLPKSPTPSDLVVPDQGETESIRRRPITTSKSPKKVDVDPPNAILEDETSLGQVGDTSLASFSLLGGEHVRPQKSDTTRVLEHAAEHEKLKPPSVLSAIPPLKISHTQYPHYTDHLGDPALAYTQVLIWCLQRRIERIERNPPQNLTTSKLMELLRVLKLAQNRLVSGHIVPQLHTHDLLQLKPRMANPENERSAQVVADLEIYRRRLLDQSRASWKLLKQAEGHNNEVPQPASPLQPNQYIPVLEEALRENGSTVQAISAELLRLDSLNAACLARVSESLDQRLKGL